MICACIFSRSLSNKLDICLSSIRFSQFFSNITFCPGIVGGNLFVSPNSTKFPNEKTPYFRLLSCLLHRVRHNYYTKVFAQVMNKFFNLCRGNDLVRNMVRPLKAPRVLWLLPWQYIAFALSLESPVPAAFKRSLTSSQIAPFRGNFRQYHPVSVFGHAMDPWAISNIIIN